MIDLNHPWLHFFRASICSNGLLYFDEKVQSFFEKFNPFVSFAISIDGNEQLHDSCRLDLNGNPTYKKAMAAVKHYNEHFSHGIPMPTKMTLAPSNIIYMYDAVINLVNEGYEEINLNCIFENGWDETHAKIMYE
jgi:sulfatase maturation enzyme AslB (radical SAM superfamily)